MTAEEHRYVSDVLRRLAALHKTATDHDKRLLEDIARKVADLVGYSYANMNLHLASMWPD